ncbi:MAG: hypothetical protein HRU40_07535 [Saprospiraceae bacterium]|nr:hypothetical protein [Saprospiraceae bacterium]
MKYRVEIKNECYLGKRYYPQYYTKEWFFGLFGGRKYWRELELDLLGFSSERNVSFGSMEDAKKYLKMRKEENIIEYQIVENL